MFSWPLGTRIVVDPLRLAALSANLKVAHDTLDRSPRYSRLDAGDVRGRVADAVSDFISKNEGPREEMVQQLHMAYQMIGVAARAFSDAESFLVQALDGGSDR